MSTLLSREEFRQQVFKRDKYRCVVCKQPGVDAHHIMERKLFTAPSELGGYFLDNGVVVCDKCHLECEETYISTADLRKFARIKNIILPLHFDKDQTYDKWGNVVLAHSAYRLQGELFHTEQVQKILKPWLQYFVPYIKYPRTLHLPWSPGVQNDDRVHHSTEQWNGKEVVITMKMDGEGTTMYRDHIHARSINSGNHESRTWVKNFWASIAHEIPDGWRICGENLYAKHSIHYSDLPSYFLGFNIWDNRNYCLSWMETLEYFDYLKIQTPETLYCGMYNESVIRSIKLNEVKDEGYVLRTTGDFTYGDFKKYVGKYVRAKHVQTDKFWMSQPITKNGLKNDITKSILNRKN
jgi:hypothetical protein